MPTPSRTSSAVHSGQRASEQRDQALATLEEVGDLVELMCLQSNVGIEAYYDGRWDDALDWYRRSGESAARIGDVVSVARAQINEAEILSDRGQFDEARALFEQALRVWRAADYRIGVAVATSNLGRVMARERAIRGCAPPARGCAGAVRGARRPGVRRRDAGAPRRVPGPRGSPPGGARCADPASASRVQRSSRSRNDSRATPSCSRGRASKQREPHFERSLEAAEAAGAEYEVALTLRAIAETSGADDGRATEIMARLGIVSTPSGAAPLTST